MSYVELRDLATVGYHGGWTMFSYRTGHDHATLSNPAYWSDAVGVMNLGDEVHVRHTFGANSIWCVVAAGDALRLACMLYCDHHTAGDQPWQRPVV